MDAINMFKAFLIIVICVALCGCENKTNTVNDIKVDTSFNYIDDAESHGFDVTVDTNN